MTQTSEDHPGVDEATREGEHHHDDGMDESQYGLPIWNVEINRETSTEA